MTRKRKISAELDENAVSKKRLEICKSDEDEQLKSDIEIDSKAARGCVNLHSTCYINVVLQVLCNSPSTLDVIFRLPTESEIPGGDKRAILQRLLYTLVTKDGEVANRQMMEEFCRAFRKDPMRTGDASEFLSEMIDMLNTWTANTTLQSSVQRIFNSKTVDKETQSVFYIESSEQSLEKAIQKQMGNIMEMPELLLFMINRVGFNKETFRVDRLLKSFTYPAELDVKLLSSLCKNVGEDDGYVLSGVIVHGFRKQCPHYMVYVLRESTWFFYDDDKVTAVDKKEVLSQTGDEAGEPDQPLACLLAYEKKEIEHLTVNIPAYIRDSIISMMDRKDRSSDVCKLKILTDECLYNQSLDLIDIEHLSYIEYSIYEEELDSAVSEYVAKRVGYTTSVPILRNLENVAGKLTANQKILNKHTTFLDLMDNLDGEKTQVIRLLWTNYDYEPGKLSVFVKIFRRPNLIENLGIFNLGENSTVADLIKLATNEYTGLESRFLSNILTDEEVYELDSNKAVTAYFVETKHVPVVFIEEASDKPDLKLYVEQEQQTFRITLRDSSGLADNVIVKISTDFDEEKIYAVIGAAVGHSPVRLQLAPLKASSRKASPIKYGDKFDEVLNFMKANKQPRVLIYTKLLHSLKEFENLQKINVMLCRQDIDKPKQLSLFFGKEDRYLKDLIDKVPKEDIPASDDVTWKFCLLNRGKISQILDSEFPISKAVGRSVNLGLAEVPVKGSGRLCSFFCYSGSYLNSVRVPGIISFSEKESPSEFKKQLSSLTGVEIKDLNLFDDSMFPEPFSFELLQENPLAEAEMPIKFENYLGLSST